MDELDLAKRAIHRNMLTEEQLREAQAFAAGGRPLISVLLDLGYLRPQDVADLGPPTTPERRSTVRLVFGGAVILLVGIFVGGLFFPRDKVYERVVKYPPAMVQDLDPDSLGDKLARRGRELLDVARTDDQYRHALELLEEARVQGQRGAMFLSALGSAREHLDRWEAAYQAYADAVGQEPAHVGLRLGAARMAINLEQYADALGHVEHVIRLGPVPEAFLLRGQVRLALGQNREAKSDLERAKTGDAATAAAAGKLLSQMVTERR